MTLFWLDCHAAGYVYVFKKKVPSSFRPLITIVIEVYWPAWLKLVRSAHRLAQWQKFNVLLVSVNPFKGIICGLAQHVLNWANFFFANLVRGIRRT